MLIKSIPKSNTSTPDEVKPFKKAPCNSGPDSLMSRATAIVFALRCVARDFPNLSAKFASNSE